MRHWWTVLAGICSVVTALALEPVNSMELATAIKPAAAVPVPVPALPELNTQAYVLMDATTGMVLAQKNANTHMAPASLTKLMTLYLISSALQSKQIALTDLVPISHEAWATGGSRMFVKEGDRIPVAQLVQGIIVASGNDATTAMAEYIGGTIPNFVNLMNQTATRLGLNDTHFMDPTGLPQENHYSTATDLAVLVRNIIEQFPEYYPWYQQKWITYNNIKQPNRNRLLWRDKFVDGLKTGHTDEAGYCLISSAKQDNMRLIAVVLGAPTDSERANVSERLLNFGFNYFKTYTLFNANQPLKTVRVFSGENKSIPVGLQEPLSVTIPKSQYAQLKANLAIQKDLHAPITQNQVVGELQIQMNGATVLTKPIIALANNPAGGWWTRARDRLEMHFSHHPSN